jgi:flagellar FliJ protein
MNTTDIAQMRSLDTLLQHERDARDQALAEHKRAADSATRAVEQSAQLIAYRDDYRSRWAAQFQQGGTMAIVHCYRNFIQRLDQAVTQQAQAAEHCAAALAHARAELLRRERQLASVRKLIERRAAEAQRGVKRREQKANDELSQRARQQASLRSRPMPLL